MKVKDKRAEEASNARKSLKKSEVIRAMRHSLNQAAAMEEQLRKLLTDAYAQMDELRAELTLLRQELEEERREAANLRVTNIKGGSIRARVFKRINALLGAAPQGAAEAADSADQCPANPCSHSVSAIGEEERAGAKAVGDHSSKLRRGASLDDGAENSLTEEERKARSITDQCANLQPYQARIIHSVLEARPKIIHVIAHFRVGGSCQLVVDLFEHLGHLYEQKILVLEPPDPVVYEGVSLSSGEHRAELEEFFRRENPDLIHIHYWESPMHEKWYRKVLEVAELQGCPLIENVNTPVTPKRSPAIDHYVYVSEYVRHTFGNPDEVASTIYPGSNFALFDRSQSEPLGDNIGMCYRLEPDKLNLDSIKPFIAAARLNTEARFLIVGGGKFLQPFKDAVEQAGFSERFEFTGYVNYADLPGLYKRMRVFIAPVWKESFGQVSPFAMHMRVPVVSYELGALPEIIGLPELLAPPGDASTLGRIAADLFANEQRCRDLGDYARARAAQKFSVQSMTQAYQALYEQILAAEPAI